MKKFAPSYLPYETSVKATKGDWDALEALVKHYRSYIRKWSVRYRKGDDGRRHPYINDEIQHELAIELMLKVLIFDFEKS